MSDTTDERSSVGAQPRPGSLSGRRAASARILVVEDERDIADFLRAFFRASGYDLAHVDPTSARHVLARVRDDTPDCVLLDVRLRGFSGFDAYRMIREDRSLDLVPVVLVTADSSAQVRAVGVAAGLDGFVGKPFSVNALERLVADRIARARELRATGVRDESGIAAEAYLQARLADEVAAAGAGGAAVAFALVRLVDTTSGRSAPAGVHTDGVRAQVAERLRDRLPPGTVVGTTEAGEIGLVLPAGGGADAELALRGAVDGMRAAVSLPGGERIAVSLAAGIAEAPRHASTADELWMAADAALAEAVDRGAGVSVAR